MWFVHFLAESQGQPYVQCEPRYSPIEALHLRINICQNLRKDVEQYATELQTINQLHTYWDSIGMRLKVTGFDGIDSLIFMNRRSEWLLYLEQHNKYPHITKLLTLVDDMMRAILHKFPDASHQLSCQRQAIELGKYLNIHFPEKRWINYIYYLIWEIPQGI